MTTYAGLGRWLAALCPVLTAVATIAIDPPEGHAIAWGSNLAQLQEAPLPGFVRVAIEGPEGTEVVGFNLTALTDCEGTAVEIRGRWGVEYTTVGALGVVALRGATDRYTACATVCDDAIRIDVVDHGDGSLHRVDEVALSSLSPSSGRSHALIARRQETAGVACGVGEDGAPSGLTPAIGWTADEWGGGAESGRSQSGGSQSGGLAGASCRRECVFLIDSDYLFFQTYGPAASNTTAAVVQTMNVVDAVYEKHVGVSFATSVIIVRTAAATDPYAGLTAAEAILDRARVEWNGTVLYQRDLVHMFSGTDYSDGIGGIAWVGVVCNSYGVGMTRFAEANVMCHEVGHNFAAPHCADEACDTMCGGCLWMGPNDKVIMTNHRNGAACLAVDAAPENPIAPDAQLDIYSVAGGSVGILLAVLANDTDYSCEPLSISSFSPTSTNGGVVSLDGSGATAQLRYTPPAGFFGLDTLSYTLTDSGGLADAAEVRVTVTTSSHIEVGRRCSAMTQSLQIAVDTADLMAGADIDVYPGRYGRVDFKGKPVRLRAIGGPSSTFIDGNGGRGVTIVGASASGAVLDGFTIHDVSAAEGGGVYVETASATIQNCRFIRPAATTRGGGIALKSTTTAVTSCVFDRATAPSGAGASVQGGNVVFTRCDFFRSTATAGAGGGVFATGAGTVKLIDCTAYQSTATSNGGAARFEGGITAQVGQSVICGGTPNNISGSYQSLGGNTITASCSICGEFPFRSAWSCDGAGSDHCRIADGTASDTNGDGIVDTCSSAADLVLSFWTTACGGNGSAYELVVPAAPITWSNALSAATARGGRLVTINSAAEANFLWSAISSVPIGWSGWQGPLIGLYKAGAAWRWVASEPLTYTEWAPGEPNGSGTRARYWSASGGPAQTWDDQPEASTAPSYIVEFVSALDCNGNGSPDARDIALGSSIDANSNGIPDECPPPCPADLDGNGFVNAQDLAALLAAWGTCASGDCAADIDGNGVVDGGDLALVQSSWGDCPTGS